MFLQKGIHQKSERKEKQCEKKNNVSLKRIFGSFLIIWIVCQKTFWQRHRLLPYMRFVNKKGGWGERKIRMLFGPHRQFYFENEELVKLYQSKREGVFFYKKKKEIHQEAEAEWLGEEKQCFHEEDLGKFSHNMDCLSKDFLAARRTSSNQNIQTRKKVLLLLMLKR